MRGLVIKSTGSSYIVLMDDGMSAECHIKGNFRIRGIRSTNPVAVGDYVEVQRDDVQCTKDKGRCTKDEGRGTKEAVYWITDVCPRRNYIIRRSTNLSKESHIIAANIDQAALIVTVNHPITSTTFIDRFLATCEAYRVHAFLIFNKIDLFTEEEMAQVDALRALYEEIGYPTLAISAKHLSTPLSQEEGEEECAKEFFSLLQGKVTLLSGNSGVGKSTLLNALFGREMTRTGKISDAHDKGMHTTTFSEMYFLKTAAGSLKDFSAIIDTPGIKGFGTIDFQRDEVSHFFPEIFRVAEQCRFSNCTHTTEPGCAVIEAVEHGEIAMSRYESYLSILDDCTESKYR